MDASFIGGGYRSNADPLYDEMWSDDGQVRPHWQHFIRALEELGSEELKRRDNEVQRLLRENGVSYIMHGDSQGRHRPWELDPIPLLINQEDWAVVEYGLIQRAELMNLILADIYGPRELIKHGLLPMELLFSHGGFLRQCDRVSLPGHHQLLSYAADLARGPDGRLWVLSDRTQSPAGAGYALENRTVMARVLPSLFKDCQVHRLSFYFRSLQTTLASLAPFHKESPRIVVLTPGPRNETYFEHAYTAAYLGYTLVRGGDLIVQDRKVWLKTIDGLRPVDVILRRVDDVYCDPLELREDSRLGVAGLLQAVREGNVVVANPLGVSVLENPGMMAFLPAISRHFLGKELALPSVASWWCGHRDELNYVLDNLEKLVIKPIFRQPEYQPVFGGRLSKKELETWRARIREHPTLFVGQEQVSFSTMPCMVYGKLEPRHTILRCFLFAKDDSYALMPGGLTRSSPEKDSLVVSTQHGGVSKDTWVFRPETEEHVSLWLQKGRDEITSAIRGGLPSRAADNLFWVGRYAVRAEATARFLRMVLRNLRQEEDSVDETEIESLHILLRCLTHITGAYPGFVGKESKKLLRRPEKELITIALDLDRNRSLASTLQSLVQTAFVVRDRWSTDTWRVISGIEEFYTGLQPIPTSTLVQVENDLDHLITLLSAFTGLNMESMTRELGWILLDIGRRIEHGLLLIQMFQAALVTHYDELVEYILLESILATEESLITYRRRYRSSLHIQTVLELLLLDETNPRSLAYQMTQLQQQLPQLPRDLSAHRLSEEERLILDASTQLRLSDISTLAEVSKESNKLYHLDTLLKNISKLLIKTSEIITNRFFSHTQHSPKQLVPINPESEEE